MDGFQTISAILRGRWLIDKGWANSHLPLVKSLIKGENVDLFNSRFDDVKFESSLGADTAQASLQNENLKKFPMAGHMAGEMFKAGRWNSFNDAPENSIAVINISGPIMKNGGSCGEPGASHFTNWIKQANQSSKITGILLVIDSPGGMVDGTQTVVDAIQNSTKPVVAFIDDGMMASGATWIGTAALEVYASQKTDTIGSIGVYCTIYDYREWLKMEGIAEIAIYAPQSTEKNKAYYDAIDGDTSILEDQLKFIATQFINGVKANRGQRLNVTDKDPFHGAMFNAGDAIKMGLIDGYATIEEAAQRVYKLAKQQQKFYA